MNVAIFADVHGNLPALELFLNATKDADLFISMGDIVNYAPWSNECVERIEELNNIIKIRGNHEEYFIDGEYGGTNPVAKAFFDFCYPQFSEREMITTYIESYEMLGYGFVHTLNGQVIFADTDVKIPSNTVLAHSHKQYITEKNGFQLVNPGSVGQNRTYINVINFMIWNTETMEFIPKEIKYDVDVVISEMENLNYPTVCLDYYKNKKRA